MNIIFLDVDGVLNSINKLIQVYNENHKPHSGASYLFDENCLRNLQTLVRETKAKIVITSTWRKSDKGLAILLQVLKDYGLDQEVIGYTPILGIKRVFEIHQFLTNFKEQPNFIIVDDNCDMDDLLPHLINTNPQIGLSEENVVEGIKKLCKNKDNGFN